MPKKNEKGKINAEPKDTREWKDFRVNLNNRYEITSETEQDWKRAIAIFSERLDDFFLKPIDFLISEYKEESENKTRTKNLGEGFSIVTLQCALIETLAAFKKGQIHDLNPQFDYQYQDSKKLFTEFLQTEKKIKDYFAKREDAENFYKNVRCGLMHETRTKSSWLIQADAELFKGKNANRRDITADTILAKNGQKGRIVFRNQLQKALKYYFETYKKNLAKPPKKYNDLRKFLARKLDHLFDIDKSDKENFDWWKHECVCKYCNKKITN